MNKLSQTRIAELLRSIAVLAVQGQSEVDNVDLLCDTLGDIQSDLNKISSIVDEEA